MTGISLEETLEAAGRWSMHELLNDLISVSEVMNTRVRTTLYKLAELHWEQKGTNERVEKLQTVL